MNVYQKLVFPLLKRIDPERAHDGTLAALERAQQTPLGRALLDQIAGALPQEPVRAFGLTFPNVLGVAAGFDKDVRVAAGLARLGFGHVEVGTLTPYPQPGNPRPRIFRLPSDQALINRMGFPNQGVAVALPRLRALNTRPRSWVLGVSLGKQKETPLDDAARDYLTVMRAVYPYADYLAVNVSSPNTRGLRELQGERYLVSLLQQLRSESQQLADAHQLARPHPLLLKLSPDLSRDELDPILAAATTTGIAGIIATNTTTARAGLQDSRQMEKGGLSGAPLADRSCEMVAYIAAQAGAALDIAGVGGVFTASDVQNKLNAGAKVVQVYTGLVYEGPGMAGRILRRLHDRGSSTLQSDRLSEPATFAA